MECLAATPENRQDGNRKRFHMSAEPIAPNEHESWFMPVPPSYEQCVAAPIRIQADYEVSPLTMAELFWDDEDD
jgi:hypothetical protein